MSQWIDIIGLWFNRIIIDIVHVAIRSIGSFIAEYLGCNFDSVNDGKA